MQWRAGDTAAEDYMALSQSGALDEMVGTDRDDEIDEDAEEQKERVHARVSCRGAASQCGEREDHRALEENAASQVGRARRLRCLRCQLPIVRVRVPFSVLVGGRTGSAGVRDS